MIMNLKRINYALWHERNRLSFGTAGLALLLFCTVPQLARADASVVHNMDTAPIFQSTITGTVVDDLGTPLAGASVVEKGTTNGTQTDFDGNFSLEVNEGATLVFSYVGFGTQEVAIAGQTEVNITMAEDAAALDEVIVLGYATQTRGDLSGAVASVDMSEATKAPIANAAEALEGRVSGVSVVNNAQPGGAPTVRIRGFGTGNSNNPLYIIDGVQTDDPSILNNLNPADIDQMNVLKDGAAAIYGARASNGVVVITTKGGGYGMEKPTISVDTYSGFSIAQNLPDMLSAQQMGDVVFQSIVNDGGTPNHPQFGNGLTAAVPNRLQGVPAQATVNPGGTDWLEELTRTALTQNASVSIQNGTESGKYLLSMGYLNRQGIQLATGFKRGSLRFNSEFKINDRLTIGEHANLSFDNTQGGGSRFAEALRINPLIPVYDDNGAFAGTYLAGAQLGNSRNPVAQALRAGDDYAKRFRVFGDVYAQLKIADGLNFKTSFGGDILAYSDRSFLALDPENAEPISVNQLDERDFDRYEWVWNNTLNYNKSFGEHSVNALVGIEAIRRREKSKEIRRTDFLFETPNFYLLDTGEGTPVVLQDNTYDGESSLFSVFGTANYSFANKYLFTATLRRDQSSRFRGDNQSDIFPSFSAGWVISNENFFPQDGLFSRLKLYGSWGQLGNQTLPADNPTVNISNLGETLANYSFDGGGSIQTGAFLSQVGNPNLRWETSETTNVGVDLGFFDNKLNITAEYFNIITRDLIDRDVSLISTTAIDAEAPLVNLGSIENTGIDLSVGIQNTTEGGFTYGVQANISHYRNEVTDLIGEFRLGNTGFRGGAVSRTEVGQPLASYYGRIVDGIFASAAEVEAHADQGFETSAGGIGRFKYRDVNGDGSINDDDRDFIGNPHPDFTYGLNLNFAYKSFDISAFFSGSQGNDLYNYNKIYTDMPSFSNTNRNVRVLDSWTPNNLDADIPRLSFGVLNNETQPNSFFVEDGSFVRLKNMQIGYSLNDQFVDKLGLSTLRFYLQGSNLFTITDYDGIDPELGPRNNGTDNFTIGVDDNQYPIAAIYTLGLNIKF